MMDYLESVTSFEAVKRLIHTLKGERLTPFGHEHAVLLHPLDIKIETRPLTLHET